MNPTDPPRPSRRPLSIPATPLHVDIDLTATNMGSMENLHIQALSRVTLEQPGEAPQTGLGVFEQLIAGPYRPYGLG